MKTLRQLFEEIKQGIDPSAESSADVILMMDQIKNQYAQQLRDVHLPSDKYKAILRFASILGIPSERFVDFIQNQENNKGNEK